MSQQCKPAKAAPELSHDEGVIAAAVDTAVVKAGGADDTKAAGAVEGAATDTEQIKVGQRLQRLGRGACTMGSRIDMDSTAQCLLLPSV